MKKYYRCTRNVVGDINRISSVSMYPFICVCMLAATIIFIEAFIRALLRTNISLYSAIVLLALIALCGYFTVFMPRLTWCIYRCTRRRIAVDKEGLTVLDRKEMLYPWHQVNSVGIIPVGASAQGKIYTKSICIFLEKPENKEIKKLIRSYEYGVLNLKRFVLIDYDSDIAQKIADNSGLTVVDYCPDWLQPKLSMPPSRT